MLFAQWYKNKDDKPLSEFYNIVNKEMQSIRPFQKINLVFFRGINNNHDMAQHKDIIID